MAPRDLEALNPHRRTELVKEMARELGFQASGICSLEPAPHADALDAWLNNGYAGTMGYMHRQASKRKAPATIVPGASTGVVLLRNHYGPDPDPAPGTGRVARYARGRDYHTALAAPLNDLCEFIGTIGDDTTFARAFVDAGPVPERELAQRAGLGWIGKNTMLIGPTIGSYFFIATVLTNLELVPDEPFEPDRCGSCRLCLDACPTDAFPEARVLDANRCISYLTIEYRGEISEELREPMGDWIFGCDVCQEVCPWNHKFAEPADDPLLTLTPDLARLDLRELKTLDPKQFEAKFGWTPLERPGRSGMIRNANIAEENQPCPTR